MTEDMIGSTIKVVVTAATGNTFESEETAEVAEPTIGLVAAKMLSADSIEVTFDQDASDYVAQEDLEVALADDTLVLPIKTLEFAEDGESAVITLTTALKDGADYKVSLGDSYVEFTASVGEVASIVILTDSAQVGVKTPIEFELYDEEGVNVTGAYKSKIDTTCQVTLDTSATFDNDKASKSTITFSTVGDTADVTITYNSNKAGAEDIVATGTITCIEADAAVGTKQYVSTTTTNANSGSAKFYKGVAQTTPITVEEGKNDPNVFFCAIDENGDAISYDSYAVESSNDDIMSASVTVDTGKFAQIDVTGSLVGKAVINITATKNGAETPYTIPVEVVEEGVLSKVTISVDKSTITNAVEQDYSGTVTVVATDTNGKAMDTTAAGKLQVNIELDDPDNKEPDKIVSGLTSAMFTTTPTLGFKTDIQTLGAKKATNTYTAYGATAGKRYIKAVVSEGDIVITKRVEVTVDALTETLWNDGTSKAANATYRAEVASKIDEGSTTTSAKAKLAAYLGNKFAGYVRQDAQGVVTIGDPVAAGTTGAAAVYAMDASDKVVTFTSTAAGGDGCTFTASVDEGTLGVFPITLSGTWANGDTVTIANQQYTVPTTGVTDADSLGEALVTFVNTTNETLKAKYSAGYSSDSDTLTLTELVATGAAPTLACSNANDNTLNLTVATTTTAYRASVAPADSVTITGGTSYAIKTATDLSAASIANAFNATPAASAAFTAEATTTNATTAATTTATSTVLTAGELPDTSAVIATESTRLTNIVSGVNYGAKYSDTGLLFDGKNNVAVANKNLLSATGDIHDFTIKTENDGTVVIDPDLLATVSNSDGTAVTKFLVSGDSSKDGSFARTGAYTMIYSATQNGKTVDFKSSVTVVNSLYIPKVTVLDRVVDSLDAESIAEVLKADVDLNNSESDHESIGSALIASVDEIGTMTAAAPDQTGTKMTVKYIPVVEDDVVFLIPINTTFKTE